VAANIRTGYSGKPLFQKLGIKRRAIVTLSIHHFIHLFEKEKKDLESGSKKYVPDLVQNGIYGFPGRKRLPKFQLQLPKM
jgi:hypothetical protein